MSGIEHLLTLVDALARRAQEQKRLEPAVAVVGEVSRLLVAGSISDVDAISRRLERLREVAGREPRPVTAAEMLDGPDGEAFLLGAAWALGEVGEARLAPTRGTDDAKQRRELARTAVLSMLTQEPVSQTELLKRPAAQDLGLRRDECSRAVAALVAVGRVDAAPRPEGADRRKSFYRLAPAPAQH